MKTKDKNTGGSAGERQSRKKKKVLIGLAAVTLLTWSRTLLGGDSEPAPAPAAAGKSAAAPAAARPAPAPAAARTGRNVTTFEQAMERMAQWPAALDRRSIQGPVADLTPAYWSEQPLAGADAEEDETAVAEASAPSGASGSWDDEPDSGGPPLKLRSTALMGGHRFAVIGNARYSEGDTVEAAGYGKLRIEEIRSREVVLRQGQRTWTLSITTILE